MRFAAFVSPDDWTVAFGTAGEAGYRYIVERCARAGIRRFYWRASSGTFYYNTRIENPRTIPDKPEDRADFLAPGKAWFWEVLDYSRDDTFAAAFPYAKRLGVEIIVWLPLEDAHGGGSTRLAREHPEWMSRDRSGLQYERICGWGFPEVRRWKLEGIREIMAYDPDGVLLDLGRFGQLSDENLVSTAGYEQPSVEGFRVKTGKDAFAIPNDDSEWIRFRASFLTQWVQSVRRLLDAQPKSKELSLYLLPPGTGGAQSISALRNPSQQVWDEQKVLETTVYRPCGPPLHSRLADVGSWAQNGWITLLSLPDHVPMSDPKRWKPVVIRLPNGGRAWGWEPHHTRDGGRFRRLATPQERADTLAYFRKLSNGKLSYSWCVKPGDDREQLKRRILELHEQGFDEINFNESNHLMHTLDDRWNAVAEAGEEIGGGT